VADAGPDVLQVAGCSLGSHRSSSSAVRPRRRTPSFAGRSGAASSPLSG